MPMTRAYTFSDGTKYIGSYAYDKSHGQGIITFADGERYEGSFAKGKWHGQGINTLPNGVRYNRFIFIENLLQSKIAEIFFIALIKIRGDFCQKQTAWGGHPDGSRLRRCMRPYVIPRI